MKNKWLCGIVAVLGFGILYFLLSGTSEPTYQGTKISHWIRVANRQEFETGLAQIGPKVIPYLAKALRTKDTPLAKAWQALWPKLPVRCHVGLKRATIQWHAVNAV